MLRVYDTAGQLLQQKEIVIETGEVISQFDFEYDALGNIIKEKAISEADIDINLEMTYAEANRLATYDGSAVQLDADGNMTSGPLSGDMANFVFDSRNRLMKAGETVYHYDVENQRIGVNQTQYVINSQFVLSQVLVKTEADGTETYYVYGLGLIGQEQSGEYLSYHFDFRGSTVALTNENAQVTEQFQYSPYGLLLSGDASITPFLFNGKYGVMTDDNGLYYMRARFYSPEMRRFVNQDMLRGRVVEGQTLNRYAYVNGDPIKYTDPYGLDRLCGGGERAVPCPDQQGVYNCVKDSKEPMKVCGGRNDEYGCLSKDAPHGGNDDGPLPGGPRPYGGAGGFVDYHMLLIGGTVEEALIGGLDGKTCLFYTACVGLGIGLFSGAGVTFPGGIAMDDVENSLAGDSIGFGIDAGTCWASYGYGGGIGISDDGITSIGSSKGMARFGAGCGASLTIDLCETTVQWCTTRK
jgi:RHS repeat-associated protein